MTIDINSAGIEELSSLPGIAEGIAERILHHRETVGPFTAVDDLMKIEGIGPDLVGRLGGLVTTTESPDKRDDSHDHDCLDSRIIEALHEDLKRHEMKLTDDTHLAILNFLNEAVRVEDLVYGRQSTAHAHPAEVHPEHELHHRKEIIDRQSAQAILDLRQKRFPLGFDHVGHLYLAEIDLEVLIALIIHLGPITRGAWQGFPVDIPRRGDGTRDGVVHAALLKNGKVLFITADETTLLWDPEDTTAATFEDPVNQPHEMPGGYSQLCGHHVQLSDPEGSLLSVGGGGYGPDSLAKAGYIFTPDTKTWTRSANDMSESKWYPTAVSLGGNRVLVTCGNRSGHMEIFNETTRTFDEVVGDVYGFPNLYPGLHLLPNNAILYSRTGWGDAGAGPGGVGYTEETQAPSRLGGMRPAYFEFDPDDELTGEWQRIKAGTVNRAKGMSVLLLSPTAPYVRIFVMGGTDNSTNHTYEILDASVLSPSSSFGAPIPFPDGEHRSLPSGVLLPDGTLFVCGGIQRVNSPCALFDPVAGSWSPMAALPSIRDYHSVALLLPNGKVMMAGWNNEKIEIYSPPYLFRGPQPVIESAPELVHHGQEFSVEMSPPEGKSIVKVVLVRPMAVTHQTDSEQKVIELSWAHDHDHAHPKKLRLRAPNGAHPHPVAPRGHYMMFAINNDGVPSLAKWVYLH